MNDEHVFEEIITKLLLNTCLLRPKFSRPAVQAAFTCGELLIGHPSNDAEANVIPLITGSVAEFYIELIILHIGDSDEMYHWRKYLAIPAGHPPPTQLPDEFRNYVHVHEIVESHSPGYVYLELRYLLTECPEKDEYNAVGYDRQLYLTNLYFNERHRPIHGPAVVTVH